MNGFRTIGSCLGISKKTEVLIMTIMSVCYNIFDMSLLQLGSNIEQIWSLTMDDHVFPEVTQHNIKSFLSAVVLIRSFTLHLYITLSIAMLWPAVNGDRPGICVPWLFVSGIKNIMTSVMALAAGIFVCAMYGGYRPACLMFAWGQIWDLIPSLYMWIIVFSYYRDLKKPKPIDANLSEKMEEMEMLMAVRRRKVRSLTTEEVLRQEIENRRKYTGTSALGLEDFFRPEGWDNVDKGTRSLDSLLEVMANEVEFQDAEEDLPEELDEKMTPQQKTMKLLGITESQINLAKSTRITPKEELPRMKLKHHKSMYLSEPASSLSRPGTSGIVPARNKTILDGKLHFPSKTIRSTKSEVKSSNKSDNSQTSSDFLNTVPESEIRAVSIHSLETSAAAPGNTSDSDDEGYGIVKKKSNKHKSKLPRRILKPPPSYLHLEQYKDQRKMVPRTMVVTNEDNYSRNNIKCTPSHIEKFIMTNDTSKVSFAPNLEEHLKTFYDKAKTKYPPLNVLNCALAEKDNYFIEKLDDPAFVIRSAECAQYFNNTVSNNILLDDSVASTNIAINISKSTDSHLAPRSDFEVSAEYDSDNSDDEERRSIFIRKEIRTIIESSRKPKMCLSEQKYTSKVPLSEIPVLSPLELNASKGYLETGYNLRNKSIPKLKYKSSKINNRPGRKRLQVSHQSCQVILPERQKSVSAQTNTSNHKIIMSKHTNTSNHQIIVSTETNTSNHKLVETVDVSTSDRQIAAISQTKTTDKNSAKNSVHYCLSTQLLEGIIGKVNMQEESFEKTIDDIKQDTSLSSFLKIVDEKSSTKVSTNLTLSSDAKTIITEDTTNETTEEILSKINDQTIRELCQKLLNAISNHSYQTKSDRSERQDRLSKDSKLITEDIPPESKPEVEEKQTVEVTEPNIIEAENSNPSLQGQAKKSESFKQNIVKGEGVGEKTIKLPRKSSKKFPNVKKILKTADKQKEHKIEQSISSEEIINIVTENENKILDLLPSTSENFCNTEEEIVVGTETVSLPPLPEIVTLSEFGCQACTLSRKILSSPPEEVTKVLKNDMHRKKKSRCILKSPTVSSRHFKISSPFLNQEKPLKSCLVNSSVNSQYAVRKPCAALARTVAINSGSKPSITKTPPVSVASKSTNPVVKAELLPDVEILSNTELSVVEKHENDNHSESIKFYARKKKTKQYTKVK